ncbi:MAG TPA: bile acid:sodium symporter [Planctomycetaceae bacterium]|nr:bile acid:sodium symporter [Planctomycetaceae bacterium]
MSERQTFIQTFSHFVHQRFLWFLAGSYVVAGLAPDLGLRIKNLTFAHVTLFNEDIALTLPTVLLGFLLFNAGLGTQTAGLRHLARSWAVLFVGLLANLLVPVAFILGVTGGMQLWHNPDEVQNILVGLALVASMPIAGSSTAWAQNANGDLALSLGLVLISTFLSPWTTPLALHAVGFMTTGDYSEDLHELASSGTGAFLFLCVLLPSIAGLGLRRLVSDARMNSVKPSLKLLNFAALLTLNYSNASVSLPQTIRDPDWDFLAVTLSIVTALCVFAFASGWAISRLLKVEKPETASLMFGLGMNNNGTGLVLASMALADHPRVLLPIIFYNLVQHLGAGIVDRLLCRAPS